MFRDSYLEKCLDHVHVPHDGRLHQSRDFILVFGIHVRALQQREICPRQVAARQRGQTSGLDFDDIILCG